MDSGIRMTAEPDYSCHDCGKAFCAPYAVEYRVDYLCPYCESANWSLTPSRAPLIKPAVDQTWIAENDGKGREITQFCGNKYKPGDPRNKRYFRSQRELIETAKREGYTVEVHR